jgi:hypothetical protein
MAAAPDGTVYCVWLDLRNHRTQVYGAASADGGASWQEERLIYESPDGSVCECCQPQTAYDPQGHLYVMWRNQLAGARDMYLAHSEDNGQTFSQAVKLGRGTWPLNACPMDGGGLATGQRSAGRRVRAAGTCSTDCRRWSCSEAPSRKRATAVQVGPSWQGHLGRSGRRGIPEVPASTPPRRPMCLWQQAWPA